MKTELCFLFFNSFVANVLILYPHGNTPQNPWRSVTFSLLKATLIHRFSGVFREYKMEILVRNGSISSETQTGKIIALLCLTQLTSININISK